jgi:hypothetical protein
MAVTYLNGLGLCQHFLFQGPPIFSQIGLKINHLATLGSSRKSIFKIFLIRILFNFQNLLFGPMPLFLFSMHKQCKKVTTTALLCFD